MHFDFVDIGTSDFETSLDVRTPSQTVLLVEPLFSYLRNLPDDEGIYKANFAVSNKAGFNSIYYVKEIDIQTYNLPGWVRGCNSFGQQHRTVVKLLNEMGLPNSLIVSQDVRTITFKNLVKLYNIKTISQLKIDTEGHDHFILPNVLSLIKQNKLTVSVIIFEYIKVFDNTSTLDRFISELKDLGYDPSNNYGDNIVLRKQ